MLWSSQNKVKFSFTSTEQNILAIYKEEFNDLFQDILTLPKETFILTLFKLIKLSSRIKFGTCPKQSISKIEKYISESYFPSEYKHALNTMHQLKRKFHSSSPTEQVLFIYTGNNYVKHCQNTKEPIHTCGNFLLISKPKNSFQNEPTLLFCYKCNQIYKDNLIKLSCSYCNNIEYYSCLTKETISSKLDLQPATWVKYHCNAIVNGEIKCSKCSEILYLNQSEEKLYCLKCNTKKNVQDFKSICYICGKEFSSEIKAYNPLEFKLMKIALKEALINQEKAFPKEGLKCGCSFDINNTVFFHKLTCKGELFLGTMYQKTIIVCSMCHSLSYYESFNWTCPICEKSELKINEIRHKKNESQDYNPNKEIISSIPKYDSAMKISGILSKFKKLNIQPFLNSSDCKTPFHLRMNSQLLSPINFQRMNKNIAIRENKENYNIISNLTIETKDKETYSNHYLLVHKRQIPQDNLYKQNLFKNYGTEEQQTQTINDDKEEKGNFIKDFEANQYEIKSLIGEGTFGKIFLVQKDNVKFAMKRLSGTTLNELNSIKKEYNILSIISKKRNINIIPIYGIQIKKLDQTTFVMYILMELAKTDWEKEIKRRAMINNFYNENELIKMLKNLVRIFSLLQRESISHRDVKPQNILICENGTLKLTDFSEAKELMKNKGNTDKQTLRGTELFMSPLLFKGLRKGKISLVRHNTYKSDVFSLGLCFLYACSLTLNSIYDIRELENTYEIESLVEKKLKIRYSTKFVNLIIRMLRYNEKERNDFIQLDKYITYEF